jgi:hypothetical protein
MTCSGADPREKGQGMKGMTKLRVAQFALLGFALGGTSTLLTSTADAAYKRVFGSVCHPANGTTAHYQATDKFFGLFNTASSTLNVVCPLVDNTTMPNTPAGKLTKIDVYGEDKNATSGRAIVVRVCARESGSAAMECGTSRSSHSGTSATFTGHTIITMSTSSHLSQLGTSGEIIYLWVTLPGLPAGADPTTGSVLRGILMENP